MSTAFLQDRPETAFPTEVKGAREIVHSVVHAFIHSLVNSFLPHLLYGRSTECALCKTRGLEWKVTLEPSAFLSR